MSNSRQARHEAVRRALIALTAVILLFPPGIISAQQTPSAAATPAAAAVTPPATVTPAATVADTVTQSIAADLQRDALAHLEQAGQWRDLAQRIAVLEEDFDAFAARDTANAELIDPTDLERQLREFRRAVTAIVDHLGAIVRRLEHDGSLLESNVRKWQERLLFLEHQRVPAPMLERARSIEAKIQRTNARVREFRDDVLLALDRALALQARIDDTRTLVATRQERIRSQRMQVERSPLWQLRASPDHLEVIAAELRATGRVLRDYLVREAAGLTTLFLGVLALTGWLFTRRSGEDVGMLQRAYGRPVAASLLIALMSLWWLAPDPPILFYEALLVLAPIPAAMLALRALPAPIPLTLYGLAFATVLLTLRVAYEASVIADRLLLLLQAICVALPVAVDLRDGRLQQALRRVSPGVVRAAALLVIAAAVVTAFHVIFGFTGPIRLVRSGMGSFLGLGLVFGATAVALYGAILAFLATPIVSWLRSARNGDPALLRALRLAITTFTIAGVAIATLGSLGLIPVLRQALEAMADTTLDVGTVSIAASAVVTAFAVAFGTLVLTGISGFVLDREVVPRLKLRPGTGYAVVTLTRWAIIIVGVVLTLAALGIDMAKVTLVAGALSVGIGFGLQNVVNNFVSGLILIVERPVGVGDLIEIGPLLGEVKRIGIRSSTVRTTQGAEVIMPNGELVSKEVVNWTRSDRQRRYDIDVGVAYGCEPEQVMRLLVEAAGEVPEIMTNPAPFAMFRGFGDSSLDFRVLAWVHTIDAGMKAQSALRVAILRKLGGAGIVIPFPQRDLHIRYADAPTERGAAP